jgi:acetyl esterase/lipase
MPEHWTIIGGLADRLLANIVVPQYPLSPEHDHRATYRLLDELYDALVNRVGADNVVISGDSAGGGLAVSFAQHLRDRGAALPAVLVLFCPWADLTVSDPAQTGLARHDRILSISRARAAGKAWAGKLLPNDPRINSLSASMAGLPPTLVLTGTHDIMNSDAHRLMTSAKASDADFTLSEYPGMFHVWMGLPIPEGAEAIEEASMFIERHLVGW